MANQIIDIIRLFKDRIVFLAESIPGQLGVDDTLKRIMVQSLDNPGTMAVEVSDDSLQVLKAGTQDISGDKTFEGITTFENDVIVSDANLLKIKSIADGDTASLSNDNGTLNIVSDSTIQSTASAIANSMENGNNEVTFSITNKNSTNGSIVNNAELLFNLTQNLSNGGGVFGALKIVAEKLTQWDVGQLGGFRIQRVQDDIAFDIYTAELDQDFTNEASTNVYGGIVRIHAGDSYQGFFVHLAGDAVAIFQITGSPASVNINGAGLTVEEGIEAGLGLTVLAGGADIIGASYVHGGSLTLDSLGAGAGLIMDNGNTIDFKSSGVVKGTAFGNGSGFILRASSGKLFLLTTSGDIEITPASGTTKVTTGGLEIVAGGLIVTLGLAQLKAGLTVTVGTTTLTAGTTAVAPLTFVSGTLKTTAGVGELEYDGQSFTATPVASNRATIVTEHWRALIAAVAYTNGTSAQNWFSTLGTITLPGSTSYFFRGELHLDNPALAHTLSLNFAGTATITSICYTAQSWGTGANVVAAVGSMIRVNTAASTLITGSVATAGATVIVEGIVRINAAGTFIPQFTFGTAAPGAGNIAANSFFKMNPVGLDTIASRGNWS